MSAYLIGRAWRAPVFLQRTRDRDLWWRGFSSTKSVDGLKVLFFGTDDFAARTLSCMMDQNYTRYPPIDHIEVVCPPTLYKRRGKKEVVEWKSTAGTRAVLLNIKVHYIPSRVMSNWEVPDVDEEAGGGKFDIGVVSSFGSFLSARIINSFPKGMINVHPSLLPLYRGPSPIQTALLNGDKYSGVTVQEVHPKRYDAGNILAQLPFNIQSGHNRLDLMALMGHLGGGLVSKVLGQLDMVRKNALVQDESKATSTQMYDLNDAQIIWETMTAEQIMRMHRAFYGSESVYSFFRVKNKYHMVKFLELHRPNPKKHPLVPNYFEYPPGTIIAARKHPYIEIPCIDGNRIHVTRFQVASKQARDAFQFNAGYIKKSKDVRMVTKPTDTKRLTPPFVYPEGYQRPTAGDFIPSNPKTAIKVDEAGEVKELDETEEINELDENDDIEEIDMEDVIAIGKKTAVLDEKEWGEFDSGDNREDGF
ncbi:Formyltransferase [Coemansia reversa NRRL 1564]|uniref:methionyl-tRNA formyltransferase n=1 Tax=Coemansia reversa (strain ATCC 12441 / NRRL 1564) TaxID=763665 RepID=A0A2G5BIG4_COERN|nr:Formyltransferase [Coemansia reversa NRRL 1564]|eukprot:PIA18808.1 Formyltransferase [Coemansia reversa NRRL 1564]